MFHLASSGCKVTIIHTKILIFVFDFSFRSNSEGNSIRLRTNSLCLSPLVTPPLPLLLLPSSSLVALFACAAVQMQSI